MMARDRRVEAGVRGMDAPSRPVEEVIPAARGSRPVAGDLPWFVGKAIARAR